MKRALVLGANGLIGHHLCRFLERKGYQVAGLSRSPWRHDDNPCDDYWPCDLRESHRNFFEGADEVYQLACEVGGLGYIMNKDHDTDCLRNSTLIDIQVLETCRSLAKKPRVFFASSACVYPNMRRPLKESDAYPAAPLNEFAWQKIFAERLYESYRRNYGVDIRIGRLFNTYGTGMSWTGGREKSIAALCRKVAELGPKQKLEVWGAGDQQRSYTYVDDTVEGIWRVMQSDYSQPINIGPDAWHDIKGVVAYLSHVANKVFDVKYIDGPAGSSSICCDTQLMRKVLKWTPQTTLQQGLEKVYPWVRQQVLDNRNKT